MDIPADGFVEPTTRYWQQLEAGPAAPPPYRYGYPATLPDGRVLTLPIRRRSGSPTRAVASFIPNQATFEVIDVLVEAMADRARTLNAEVIIALPTLGLALAPGLARALGHTAYAPLGTSRKFWYEDRLSVPVSSVTSPDDGKRLYMDPNLRPRVEGRRALLVDDTISSGTTILAAARLAEAAGAEIVGLVFAMGQSTVWQDALAAERPDLRPRVQYLFHSPLLELTSAGWTTSEQT